LRDRDPGVLDQARSRLREQIDQLAYLQWIADAQWRAGRSAANAKGVKVLGDLPFMVAEDSSDVWSFQRLFKFDATVGVPPDAYSADGQTGGCRCRVGTRCAPPATPGCTSGRSARGSCTTRSGWTTWSGSTAPTPARSTRARPSSSPPTRPSQQAQGERVLGLLGEQAEVLAEDLGTVPDFVRASLAEQEIPGTKVLRWENDQGVPRDVTKFSHVSVAVTGTHDTESLRTWWEGLTARERELQLTQAPLARLKGPDQERYLPETQAAVLELAYSASSDALLTPVTDALGWADRMNTPGTVGPHNWTFRLPWTLEELFSAPEPMAMARELAHLAERSAAGGREGSARRPVRLEAG